MRIYVTGDIHGNPQRLSSKYFPDQNDMTKEDIVVILGDFGLVFEQQESDLEKLFLDWLEQKNFTVVSILGNHENYDRIEKLPVVERFGAPVYQLRSSVFLLQSGYIYNFGNRKAFVFNGAASHDISDGLFDSDDPDWMEKVKALKAQGKKYIRVKGIDWWPQEVESDEKVYERGITNLEAVNYDVDFVFTHCASDRMEKKLGVVGHGNRLTAWLDQLEDRLPEKTWWLFGHYHVDAVVSEKRICLYEQMIRIE